MGHEFGDVVLILFPFTNQQGQKPPIRITAGTSPIKLAAIASQALEAANIKATL